MATYTRPFRLRVLDKLTEVLQTITVANGYTWDLDTSVFRGRRYYGENDPLPMLSILENLPLDQIENQNDNSGSFGQWELVIQGFVLDDPLNPTDPGYFLLSEVKAAIAKHIKSNGGKDNNLLSMGGLVDKIAIGSGTVSPPDDISAKAYFWLRLTIHIIEDLSEPYE